MINLASLLVVSGLAASCAGAAISTAPVVDLGYGLWQGNLNATGQYYNFSNVRYAQAPIGNLRFAPPQSPLVNRSIVHDGQDGRICPQGTPSWTPERNLFYRQYLQNPNNISAFTNVPAPGINPSARPPTTRDPRTNEDCLFLEVLVPKTIYDNSNSSQQKKAPVLVWTYGGGFYEGNIESQGSPAGLLARSMASSNTSPGMIYVSINYRLGALGWLGGSAFNASGGVSNAGLYDQRLALEWVQEHISKFGGDPSRVTLAGESAGASMSYHQLTAFGNSTPAPFQQLFTSSPAFQPMANQTALNLYYKQFLKNANVTSLAELRSASSEVVINASELSIFQAPYGSSSFGPVIGDAFVPLPPSVLLSQGRYAKNIKAYMASHNTDEGLLFANPAVQNTSAFNAYVSQVLLPSMSQQDFNYLTGTLYPAVFTNQTGLGYNSSYSRFDVLISDYLVNCNADAMLKKLDPDTSRAFLFNEGAGLHGEDTPYIFYNPPGPVADAAGIGLVNQTSAQAMQDWIVNFVITGNPNGVGWTNSGPQLPVYEPNRAMGLVSSSQLGLAVIDPAQEQRCLFWQSGKYLGIPGL